jgi:UDP-glucuronate 4-epimerase
VHALVTGAAGFIGSSLVDFLLAAGHQVRGVDCFTSYYDPGRKRRNLMAALPHPRFELIEADLATCELAPLLGDIDVVYHLAGQPGVRRSWSAQFAAYVTNNVCATQRLLEAVARTDVGRLVNASSSSVYGDAPVFPTVEAATTRPISPYGVTKLAAELLCCAYATGRAVPAVSLRYFTVYGPRQRPDMAMYRLVAAATGGPAFPLYGGDDQIRDFTYVADVVAATALAGTRPVPPGTVLNIAGGSAASLGEVIAMVEKVTGSSVVLDRRDRQPGDVTRTGGATERAGELLGWTPRTGLLDGLQAQADWQRSAG